MSYKRKENVALLAQPAFLFIASLGKFASTHTHRSMCHIFRVAQASHTTPSSPICLKKNFASICVKTLAPLEPLTLQQIQNEVQAGKNSATGEIDYSQLEALLQEKLKKFAAFNSCFGSGRPITYEHCGVDLEETRKAFALLLAMVWFGRVH